jgi:FtsP/CotA-like multicopper oxidase with cupredoxin domain
MVWRRSRCSLWLHLAGAVGVHQPPPLDVPGRHLHLRLSNLRLSLSGQRFHEIDTDGGPIAALYSVDEVLIAPGGRFDLVVGPFTDGETVVLEALPHNRGAGRARRRTLAILQVAPADSASRAGASTCLARVIDAASSEGDPHR